MGEKKFLCASCGNGYVSIEGTRCYSTPECRKTYQRERRERIKQTEVFFNCCEICGDDFETVYQSKARFCPECRVEHLENLGVFELTCEACAKPFESVTSHARICGEKKCKQLLSHYRYYVKYYDQDMTFPQYILRRLENENTTCLYCKQKFSRRRIDQMFCLDENCRRVARNWMRFRKHNPGITVEQYIGRFK